MIDVDQAAAKAAGGNRFALAAAVGQRANAIARWPLRRKHVAYALAEADDGEWTARPEPQPQE